jgi:hypothetical protein
MGSAAAQKLTEHEETGPSRKLAAPPAPRAQKGAAHFLIRKKSSEPVDVFWILTYKAFAMLNKALFAACLAASCAADVAAFAPHSVPHLRSRAGRAATSDVSMTAMPLGQRAAAAAAAGLVLAGTVIAPPADAAYNFPPIDKSDKNRCEFRSSAIGQSNAARDKLYDLRECDLSNKDAKGIDVAGAIMLKGIFSKTDFSEATMSKVYAEGANFEGAKFTSAVIDRSSFKKTKMNGAVLANTVLSGTSFEGADLTDTDFSDAYMGDFDSRNLCKNPTLQGTNPVTGVDTRASAACKQLAPSKKAK